MDYEEEVDDDGALFYIYDLFEAIGNLKLQKVFKKLNVIYNHRSEYKPRSLTWKSSNKNIATVSSSGRVIAKKPGKCTITCKLPNDRKAKCEITVVKNEYKGKSLSECNANVC